MSFLNLVVIIKENNSDISLDALREVLITYPSVNDGDDSNVLIYETDEYTYIFTRFSAKFEDLTNPNIIKGGEFRNADFENFACEIVKSDLSPLIVLGKIEAKIYGESKRG